MRYRPLPNTDLSPSVICLGAGEFGHNPPRDECFRMLDRFVELGGTFLDTANVYFDWVPGEKGRSEKTLGEWLESRGVRGQMVVGTKGAHPNLDAMHIPRLAPEDIRHDIDVSLERLRTDHIDVYYLHRDDPARPVSEILGALNEAKEEGKLRALGCSNWSVARSREANEYAAAHGLAGFVISQIGWSLAEPMPDRLEDKTLVYMDDDILAFHRESGLACAGYASQAKGFFSGRYGQGIEPTDRTSAAKVTTRYYCETNFRRLERAQELAEGKGRTANHIALAYLTSQPFPGFAVCGCRTLAQLEDSCAGGEVELNESEVSFLVADC
ncbi:MAG: aldo/keto reductase [Armatimonadetes bacterium CG_4_10_14_3_um_filter_66_18]|nr:aldo/keto reductase [Armatimonadota bacterium]OIP09344.1 MAG: hypothetical protein AUJ96_05305 [Armatimonadetes bacterium CG2_30_66_41]PIU87945.1 MAG: aldo/keto reductase [Armatimonadetes bacterium CG06_land_8_20_14_3_00_66_21]PIX46614.1 MAG: aldo/keto reductase [Armatimonadetes bacterium CG_4_8_14_3_um_filter_66_20]PIY38602.1 MAG: aldo/keto reductase [Armatimonadetes bacterium CG_4_10_14_3_um_filter_66_18]PIZ45490.1 MAG: aldo/keto reductase [Armatimonadetes bacterium CG_4_10_14_0_8_um_filt